MNELEIGDRVRIISLPDDLGEWEAEGVKIIIGMKATVRECGDDCAANNSAGVEFDDYMGGHDGDWGGKQGHCWCVAHECLEKIEETDTEETKAETMEQKILKALREEIGVDVGEDFDVYEEDEKVGTYRFGENNFFCKVDDEIYRHGGWEDIVCNFSMYTFKRKPFVPEYGKDFFLLVEERDENNNIIFVEKRSVWVDSTVDCGMLALGNVFRSKEEALENKDKVLEKLEKLRRGEV
jgi:hypothetical protein